MELKNKKTTLGDDAALYEHRTSNMTTKEKWNSLDKKGKWDFFMAYFLPKIVGIGIVGGLLISLLVTIFKPKPDKYISFTVSDMLMSEEEINVLKSDFLEYKNLDPEKNTVQINSNCYFLTDEVNARQFFMVYYAVGELDVTLMPLKAFNMVTETPSAANGMFVDVNEYLTPELKERFKDDFVYVLKTDSEGNEFLEGTEYPCGIIVKDSKYISGNFYSEPMVIAVNGCTKDLSKCTEMIEFLFK